MLSNITANGIDASYRSDHSMIGLSLKINDFDGVKVSIILITRFV